MVNVISLFGLESIRFSINMNKFMVVYIGYILTVDFCVVAID